MWGRIDNQEVGLEAATLGPIRSELATQEQELSDSAKSVRRNLHIWL